MKDSITAIIEVRWINYDKDIELELEIEVQKVEGDGGIAPEFIEYTGIIKDVDFNHIFEVEEPEKAEAIKNYYKGKRISINSYGWWEIHN